MGKDKLRKFAELKSFNNVYEPTMDDVKSGDYKMKGLWRSDYFKNDNPIVLELGCGKGEYTVGLGRKYTDKNFIGVDIKGNRIWRGAKTAIEDKLTNIGFIRTRIEFIESFFKENEVDEIWLTFSDPQPRKSKARKRLSSRPFIERYLKFLKPNGIVHIKTDSTSLFEFTMEQCEEHNYDVIVSTFDLYGEMIENLDESTQENLSIRTHYEQLFMDKGEKIKYSKFRIHPKG